MLREGGREREGEREGERGGERERGRGFSQTGQVMPATRSRAERILEALRAF